MMRKIFGISTLALLLGSAAAQAVTLQENPAFPEVGVIASQTNWTSQLGLQDRLISGNRTDLSVGQSFRLEEETTLRAITFQNHGNKTWNTAVPHVLELWIGENTSTNESSFVAGATNLLTTLDVAGMSLTALNYYTINLDSDLVLPAGDYGYQLNWTTLDSSHFFYLKRIDGGGSYTNGGWLYDTTIDGVLPFDDPDVPVANDLVFGLHSSVVGTIASASVDPEEISMLLVPPDTTAQGSVDFSFASDTNLNISISITDESHPTSFSVLSANPQIITNTTTLEFEFDNAVAGLANGETATGNVVIAWNEIGSTTTNETVVPISVANGVAAADNVFTGTISENWGNPSNWDQGRVPGSLASDPAFVQDALTATVATNFNAVFPWGTTVRGGATLNIDADLLNMTYMRVGYDSTQYGTVNQSAGDVDLATQFWIGDNGGSAASNSVYTLSGGSLDLLGNTTFITHGTGVLDINGGAFSIDHGPANININGEGRIKVQSGSFTSVGTAANDVLTVYTDVEISGGTVDLNGQNKFVNVLKVIGDSATVNIDRINTPPGGNIGDMVFEMGETGISTINGAGWGTLSAYNLTVNGGAYIGGSATFTLYDCANLTAVPASYTVTNFAEGVTATVTNDAATHSLLLIVDVPGYQGWIGEYGLSGSPDADADYDYDSDGEDNFYEYAFGGDPTNGAVLGNVPVAGAAQEGGTNFFEYVYARRIGSETELDYQPQFGTSLAFPDWSGDDVVELPVTGTIDEDYEAVTNRVDMDGKPVGFMQVTVDQL